MKQVITNTEILMFILGWQGGTIHQLAEALFVPENKILDADYEEMQNLMRLAQSKKCSVHSKKEPKYLIGTKYKTKGKAPKVCTITDIHFTSNMKGEVLYFRYVSEHEFMGQIITNRDVCETTVSMGLIQD